VSIVSALEDPNGSPTVDETDGGVLRRRETGMNGSVELSVTVPVYNEEANVQTLVNNIVTILRLHGRPFEVIVVDDGSEDRTLAVLRDLLDHTPELRVVELSRNFGQTLALQAALDLARGDIIVTMDGDLQNDPADIPMLLEHLEGADVVSGWRRDRQDTLVLRKFPSWVANRIIRAVTGVPIHDQGCALKAYRAAFARQLDLYGDMHRFIAILAMAAGARIVETEVRHHPRTAGESKYGISRTFKVLADLFTVQMLTWFRSQPLRFFALIAAPFLIGSVVSATLPWLWSGWTPIWISVSLFCALTAGSCVLVGMLGEALNEAGEPRGRRMAPFRER